MMSQFKVGDEVEYLGDTFSFTGAMGIISSVRGGGGVVDVLITQYPEGSIHTLTKRINNNWAIYKDELSHARPAKSIEEFL